MDLKKMQEKVKSSMSEARFNHTLGVVSEAEKLAKIYNVDPEKAKVAALLHDVAKEMTKEEVARYTKEHEIDLSYLEEFEKIIHAHMGYYIAKDKFGIQDEEILNAIKSHTTGRVGIDTLGKIIFTADFIEPGRNFVDCKEEYEHAKVLAYQNIHDAYTYVLKFTIAHIKAIGQIPYIDTLEAYDAASSIR